MRSEKQVYDIILTYAKADERVRMVTLEGSRTNTNIPPDDFQDYDITFFVQSSRKRGDENAYRNYRSYGRIRKKAD